MDYKANILIVDDLSENLLAMEAALEDLGQNIYKATSGQDALRHLLKEDFAVILLDVSMPIMDGFELAHLIRERERSRHTPIIFVTAFAQEERFLRRGYELGALDYLFKPYAPEILRWKVGVLVDLYLKTLESEHYAEIQRLNHELEMSNLLKSKFLHLISHELRTPLTAIKGFTTTLLQADLSWDDLSEQQFLQIIDEESDNLTALIDQLLTMTHIEANTLKLVRDSHRLHDIVTEALPRLNAVASGREIIVDIPENIPNVIVDPWQITQVLNHLVANASKYSPQNSTITLRAKVLADAVQIDVHDEGFGIPLDQQQRVFEPFYRADNRPAHLRGAGLGLAIAKAIIEQHNGTIWLESKEGSGSTISFTLPLIR